jgi:ATP dependent DNA ligase C terminal region
VIAWTYPCFLPSYKLAMTFCWPDRASHSRRDLPGSQGAPNCEVSIQNLPEKRASRWGESLTAEKMDQCRWVKPKLVCQVAFVEWTDAGHLRHCTFIGMRDDKKAAEVVRET